MTGDRREAFRKMVERFNNLPEKKQDQMLWYGKAILDIEESESSKKEPVAEERRLMNELIPINYDGEQPMISARITRNTSNKCN